MIRRFFFRKSVLTLLALTVSASCAFGQARLGTPVAVESQPKDSPRGVLPASMDGAGAPLAVDYSAPSRFHFADAGDRPSTFLTGNRDFPNFIGFISNPVQSIDPRSTTELVAMFGSGWLSANNSSVLPSGNMQVYGGGPMAIAVNDRLCFGLNDGGYAVANFSNDREKLLRNMGLPIPDRDRGGQREGWLNLGGYFQYTLIADVPNQFIFTAGLRWEAPAGATQVFQGGANPAYLAPYVTMGKEFGCYHFLATTGYEFPAGSGDSTTRTLYLNVHLDRKIGWLYPLIELNGAYHTSATNISFSTPHHQLIDLGTFESTGNTLTAAIGANAVLIPGKLEFGAVYIRPIAAQGHFDSNGLLVKMVYRY
jgi:hypothetical protein